MASKSFSSVVRPAAQAPAGLRLSACKPSQAVLRNASARTPVVVRATSHPKCDFAKLFDSVETAPMRLGTALSTFITMFGAAAAAQASELDVLEQELSSSFSVDLGGYAVDHKTLIYGVMIGQWVALIGAGVGGWSARQKGIEMEELNAKIIEVNNNMRKMRNRSEHAVRIMETFSEDEEPEPIQLLKVGKSYLKEMKAMEAKQVFEKSLQAILAAPGSLYEPWKAERKARRGIGAACVQLKMYEEAEESYLKVVNLCESNIPSGEERPELADAYGALADMYTDWGKLEKAAEVYDKMILELA